MNDKVNINTATEKELQRLVHIGPGRAKKIIAGRPYKDIFELSNIPGIGQNRMMDIFNENLARI